MNEKLPIIDQLHNADGDRERAKILLQCPDAVLLKYAHVFRAALRDFSQAAEFVEMRVAVMHAVRNAAGGLPGGPAMELSMRQAELAAFAAGHRDPEITALDQVEGAGGSPPPHLDI